MKKIIVLLGTISLIFALSATSFSANAANVSFYSTEANQYASDIKSKAKLASYSGEDEYEGELPSFYSSVELGYTTPVKTQSGNLCWAYSSLAAYESYLLKNNLFYGDLSVNDLDIWGSVREDGTGWQRGTSGAGYCLIPIGYFTSWEGPVTDDSSEVRYGTTALRFYTKDDTQDDIKRAVKDYGAVTANLNYNALGKSIDENSYFITDAIGRISGHTVTIVGWDDNYSKDNFTGNYEPQNDGAWLCKNSWGDNNSIGGYLWISYEDYYLLNYYYFDQGFSIVDAQPITENDHLYQNEEYGATYEFNYINQTDLTFYNVFDFSEYGNRLDKIIFETPSVGAEYDIYYVPLDEDGVPLQNREKWTALGSGTVDYWGYICADIENKAVPKVKAAIAVKLKTSGKGNYSVLGVTEMLQEAKTKKKIFTETFEYGKSFIEFNDNIMDLKEFYKKYYNEDDGGVFVIKAISDKTTNTEIKGDVNLDEIVNINDVSLIQFYLANLKININAEQITNADFNGDGTVNILDATSIQLELTIC